MKLIILKGSENKLLQLTIQNKEQLQVTGELKNRIAESVSNYILSHWDETVTVETIDDNHIISIDI